MDTLLKRARERAGYASAADFARTNGFLDVTYRSHENGTRPLTIDAAKRYAPHLGLGWTDLIDANEEALDRAAPPMRPLAPRAVPGTPSGTEPIPEVDVRGGMGGGGQATCEVNGTDEFGNMIPHDDVKVTWALPSDFLHHELRVTPARTYLIEVKGDSMSPTLESGDRVMIDSTDTVPSPGGIFALWDGLGVVVKRLEHIPNSDPAAIRIISDNPHHEAYQRTLDEVRIIGRVVWYGRRL